MQFPDESCSLLQTMDISLCDIAGNSGEDTKESVPEGTMCMLDPEGGDTSIVECVEKTWVQTGCSVAAMFSYIRCNETKCIKVIF